MKSILLFFFFSLGILWATMAQSVDNSPIQTNSDSLQIARTDSIRQVDLVDYVIRIFKIKDVDKKRDNTKIKFSLFPTTSNTSGDRALVTSFSAAFLLGDIKNTNISTVYFYPYISFSDQFGIQLTSNIWTRENNWNFVGEYFALNYPQNTWGLGGNSPDENETLVQSKHLRFHQNAMIGVHPHFAVGLGYSYDRHYEIYVDETDLEKIINSKIPIDTFNTTSSGLTWPAIYDNRNSPINAQRGEFFSATYNFFSTMLGSDNSYQSLFLDFRKYFTLPYKHSPVLAFRSYYWTLTKGVSPYFDLPTNRWEPASGSASRGIQKGRYRSNAMLYFESEYRFGISQNGLWGGVVFADVLAPSEYKTQNFQYWHPAAGVGLRLKLNKYSRTNVALDLGMSKGFTSVYLNIGEAF